jgi:hypothetical protein
MAMVAATSDQRYQGLSSDEWPTGASNGAMLHIVDTGEQFVFHDGQWFIDLRVIYPYKALV